MKKNIFRKSLSVICAFAVAFVTSVNIVYAEENEKIILPSGKSIDFLDREFEYINNTYGDSENPEFASAAAAVFQGNEVVFEKYYGETDLENHIKADENSVYEWGSISKIFIWVSVMQLWEQGRIDFEKDVHEYLPEGFFKHLSYDEPITMLNLMNHNAGWQESTWEMFTTNPDVPSFKDALQNLEPAQINPPGKVHAYSNYGAAVAAYVVECITGTDFCAYVHKNILEPLGMEHTSVNPTHSDNDFVYSNIKNTKPYKNTFGNMLPALKKPQYVTIYPAGAMAGTLRDLIVFAQALADDSAPLFQNPETQKAMLEGTLFLGKSDIPACAHGFFYMEYGVRTFGHSGGTQAGLSNMIIDPESKTGAVILVNQPAGNEFYSKISELVFGNMSPEKYASENMEKADLNGYITMSRSRHKGIMKILSFMSTAYIDDVNAVVSENDVIIITSADGKISEAAGYIKDDNGDIRILEPSDEIIPYKYYPFKFFMIMLYIFMALFSGFMLLIRSKMKKYGKLQKQRGSFIVVSGYTAKILSVVIFLAVFALFNINFGITHAMGIAAGIMQIVCIIICCAEIIYRIISAVSEKNKFGKIKNISSVAANIAVVSVILMFDMYRFWGI